MVNDSEVRVIFQDIVHQLQENIITQDFQQLGKDGAGGEGERFSV